VAANVRLYSPGADHKEHTSYYSPIVGMTSLPERTAKKTLVAYIVALHGNGYLTTLPLLTVDLLP
jgi:hypothetical protein